MPTSLLPSLADLDNDELLARTRRLAGREREATAALVAHLSEIDARRLYLGQGCSSLFGYCTQVLALSEDAAYARIEAARAARKYPVILEMLEGGALHLTGVRLLAPQLTPENHEHVLGEARNQSRRAIEEIVARLCPRPDAPTVVRQLPATPQRPVHGAPCVAAEPAVPEAAAAPPPPKPAVVAALSPGRFLVQFTGDAELDALLRRAHDLTGLPRRDAAEVVKRALALLVKDLERKRLGAARRPRPQVEEPRSGSRHVPSAVKREVSERDGGRCTFVGADGRRCTETFDLHFAHRKAHAKGGRPTSSNLLLMCARHNAYEAVQEFGEANRDLWKAREPAATYGYVATWLGTTPRGQGRPERIPATAAGAVTVAVT